MGAGNSQLTPSNLCQCPPNAWQQQGQQLAGTTPSVAGPTTITRTTATVPATGMAALGTGLGTIGQNLSTGLSNIGKNLSGAAQQALRSFASDYVYWKAFSDYDQYMKPRKYFTWKQYCNGDVQNWGEYARWKRAWKNSDYDSYRNDYDNWRNNYNGIDENKWREWQGWKEVKDYLQKESLANPDELMQNTRRSREFLRWKRRANIHQYARFLKFHYWEIYSHEHHLDINDEQAYETWSRKVYQRPDLQSSAFRQKFYHWKNSAPTAHDVRMYSRWRHWQDSRFESFDDDTTTTPWYSNDKRKGRYYQNEEEEY